MSDEHVTGLQQVSYSCDSKATGNVDETFCQFTRKKKVNCPDVPKQPDMLALICTKKKTSSGGRKQQMLNEEVVPREFRTGGQQKDSVPVEIETDLAAYHIKDILEVDRVGQGYEDHLVTQEADILEVDRVQWRKIDAQLCSVLWQSVDPKILLHLWAYKTCFKFWTQAKGLYTNDIQRLYKVASAIVHISQQDLDLSTYIGQIASLKEEFLTMMPLTPDVGAQQTQLDKFFMVLTLISLRPDLEPVRDQILGSSSIPSLDDVFARLLRISSIQTFPFDSTSDSSVLVSQTSSRGGRSGTRGSSFLVSSFPILRMVIILYIYSVHERKQV
ncbi:hypothetical protein VitviT2T_002459 [Vitis vinifera]|uniref:Uncharacterized protein n=1 Tax=Vitis vinifera TaxID=29760 RepID=A0ABY9BIJ3_VITVI|nr:hypothetical protein VitviT2T_002459 [Vitis vinifera]